MLDISLYARFNNEEYNEATTLNSVTKEMINSKRDSPSFTKKQNQWNWIELQSIYENDQIISCRFTTPLVIEKFRTNLNW